MIQIRVRKEPLLRSEVGLGWHSPYPLQTRANTFTGCFSKQPALLEFIHSEIMKQLPRGAEHV